MKIFLAIAVLGVLAGCASMGLAPATTTQDQIAYAYSGVNAALNTLASATQEGLLSSAEATQVNSAILSVKAGLDAAESAAGSGSPNAASLLLAATQALTGISTYLACKQVKGATCQLQ